MPVDLKSIGTGAGTGAAVGSVVPGIGTVGGGIAGGAIGGAQQGINAINEAFSKKKNIVQGPALADAAQYGGYAGGAADARDAAWAQQGNNDAAQAGSANAAAYAAGQSGADRGPMAHEDAGLSQNELNTRNGYQNGAIGLAGSLARGNTPSAAAYQLQAGLDQGLAQQTSMGRSGRGAAALSTGEGNAQANSANLQQNAFTAGGQLRAQDMAAGRGLYGSMTTQQRQQDQERLNQGNAMQQGNAARNDAYGLGMGQLATGFGELGNAQDQTDFGYYQQGMAPINDQYQANQQRQEWDADRRKQVVAENQKNQDDTWP